MKLRSGPMAKAEKGVYDMSTYAITIPTILPERQKELGMLLCQIAQLCPFVPIAVSPHAASAPAKTDCVRALMRGAAFGCPWTVYLEDDAFLAPVFDQEVRRILSEADKQGFSMATFYSNAQRTVDAMSKGKRSCMIEPRFFWASVCVAVRTELIYAIADFAPIWYNNHPEHWHASDLLLAAFCSLSKSNILVCIPSPVQHRDSLSTLSHNKKTKRISRTFKMAYGPIPV